MVMKKYTDVVRLGHRSTTGVLKEGDYIIIEEKLDGANASFKLENGVIHAFSRSSVLNENNNLRGFYEWTQTLDVHSLCEGVIYFGEWLVKHKIDYGENANKFYLFDIFDISKEEYLPFSKVDFEATRLGLCRVPVFYQGTYVSFDHLMTFVGMSQLGEKGEGVVVKNESYRDKCGCQTYVKLVSDSFREVQKQKAPKDPNRPLTAEQAFISMTLTEARVEKLLLKLVDEGFLSEEFSIEDMGLILKHLGSNTYEDIMKEESDSLPEEFDEKEIRRSIGKKLPSIVKSILTKRN